MMTSKQIAFLIALAAGGIAMYPIRTWIRAGISRNLARAPRWLTLLGLAVFGAGFVLAAAHLVPLATITTIWATVIIVAVIWGWVRYHRSPHLRRWETTHEQLYKLLDSNPDAADQVMMDTIRQDDAELEQLRAAAPNDRRAALEFQRRTERELRTWARSTRDVRRLEQKRPSVGQAGSALMSRRRQKLEADLEWIRHVLSGPDGAA